MSTAIVPRGRGGRDVIAETAAQQLGDWEHEERMRRGQVRFVDALDGLLWDLEEVNRQVTADWSYPSPTEALYRRYRGGLVVYRQLMALRGDRPQQFELPLDTATMHDRVLVMEADLLRCPEEEREHFLADRYCRGCRHLMSPGSHGRTCLACRARRAAS